LRGFFLLYLHIKPVSGVENKKMIIITAKYQK